MCDKDQDKDKEQSHYDRFIGYGHPAGRPMDGAIPERKWMEKASVPSYTPLLVTMMLEMYVLPDRRAYYLYGNAIDSAQREVLDLLKRAKIVVPAVTPPMIGAAQMWNVDEEALRVYVRAVCSVPLPDFKWVMP